MASYVASAKINVKAAIILTVVVIVLVAAAGAGWYIRREAMHQMARTRGQEAYTQQDWQAATVYYRRYLSREATDAEILSRYAEANLRVRPQEPHNIGAAIDAYERLTRLEPHQTDPFEKLAYLYGVAGSHSRLAYLARQRLEHVPGEPRATLWLVEALIAQDRTEATEEATRLLQDLLTRLEAQSPVPPQHAAACRLMGDLVRRRRLLEPAAGTAEGLTWLDRSVEYAPESPDARVGRAQYLRRHQAALGLSNAEMHAATRADLELAAANPDPGPLVLAALSEEWMRLGAYDQAAAALDRAASLGPETIAPHFANPDHWLTMQFLQHAKLGLLRGQPERAVALADDLLERFDQIRDRMPVLESSVGLYLAVGRTPDARQCLDEYLDGLRAAQTFSATDPQVAYLRALVLQHEDHPDKWQRIVRVLQPAAGTGTPPPGLHRLLGQAYARTGQSQQAVQALSAHLQALPTDHATGRMLIEQYMLQGRWGQAVELARALEQAHPRDLDLRLQRIDAMVQLAGQSADQFEDLRVELSALQHEHPRNVHVRLLAAVIALRQGQAEQAEQILRQAVQECDRPGLAEMQLARLLARPPLNRPEEAVQTARSAAQRPEAGVAEWLALAGLTEALGQPDQARQVLQEALSAVSPEQQAALTRHQAMLDLRQGRTQEGIASLTDLAAQHPHDLGTRIELLSLPEVLGDAERAQTLVDEIRAIEGDAGLLWRLHQSRLWLAGPRWPDNEQSISAYLNACLGADPGWATAALLLGDFNERRGDFRQAEAIYRSAVQANPAAVEVTARLASLLEQQRRYHEARQVLARLDSDSEALSALSIRLSLREDNPRQALEDLQRRIQRNPQDAGSRVLLARLVFAIDGDGARALSLLDEAQALEPDSLAPLATRVAVLRAQGLAEEVGAILDAQVEHRGNFEAYLLRGAYRASEGLHDLAEQDYRHLATLGREGAGHEVLARYLYQAGRIGESLDALEQGVIAYPENAVLRELLMRGLLDQDDPARRERGRELLADLLQGRPDDPDLLRTQAALLLRDPTPQAARQARPILERIVRAYPSDVEAHQMLITMTMQEHDFQRARTLAAWAVQRNPRNAELIVAQAQVELQLGEFASAGRHARQALSEAPAHVQAHHLAMTAAMAEGNRQALQEQHDLLTRVLAQVPDVGDLQRLRASVLAAMGREGDAIAALEAFARTAAGQDESQTYLELARLNRRAGELNAADAWVDRVADKDSASPDVLRERVMLLGARSDLAGVADLMSAGDGAACVDPTVLAVAGGVLGAAESPEHRRHAIALYERAVNQAPRSPLLRLQLALLTYQAGDADRAVELYREVLQIAPNHPRALNDLAWILAQDKQQYDEAIRLADRGVQVDPDNHHLRDTRGVILSHFPDRLAEAQSDFVRLITLTINDPPAHARALARLGRLEARQGAADEARRRLERALEIDRDHQTFTDQERTELHQTLSGLSAR